MKRIFLLTIAMVTLCMFSSCGGKEEPIEKMIPAANVEITGPDANTISVAGDVKLFLVQSQYNEQQWSMKALVPLKNKETIKAKEIYSVQLDVNDANYSLVNEYYGMVIQDESILISLFDNNVGVTKNIVFRPRYEALAPDYYKKMVDYINKSENIIIKLCIDDPNETKPEKQSQRLTSSVKNPTKQSTPSKSSGSTSWDKLLDDYEAFVDKYIELYKKAMKGDNSAMTTYVEYLEKAENLADRLDDADDDMTTAQLTRYMKITNKMSEAAIELAGETSTYGYDW